MSLKLDAYCTNTSCGRRRDIYSTLYNDNDHTPESLPPPTTLIDHGDESQSSRPDYRQGTSASVAKKGKKKATIRDRTKKVIQNQLLISKNSNSCRSESVKGFDIKRSPRTI